MKLPHGDAGDGAALLEEGLVSGRPIGRIMSIKGPSGANLEAVANVLGLTQSEIAFCQRLLLGKSLIEAAEQLGITQGTARTRLKTIFQKTGTSRQSELMLMLVNAS